MLATSLPMYECGCLMKRSTPAFPAEKGIASHVSTIRCSYNESLSEDSWFRGDGFFRREHHGGTSTRVLMSSLAAADDTSLPPSIAKLKSRKNEASRSRRRAPAAPGARAQADARELARRDRSDGRHVASIFHRHTLVGRRAARSPWCCPPRAGVLRVPSVRGRPGPRADRESSRWRERRRPRLAGR